MELSERIPTWDMTRKEIAKKVARLEDALKIEKQKHLDTSNWALEQQDRANQLEADKERYLEALRSIAGTNTKPSHLKHAWKEMMLVAKQRAKKALGGES